MFDRVRSWFRRRVASERRDEQWELRLGPAASVMPVVVHARAADTIVVMLPGWNAAIDGYASKYRKIADRLHAHGFAVVRTDNAEVPPTPFEVVCRARARAIVAGAVERAVSICGRRRPRVFAVGFSAGGGAFAAVAHEWPCVRRLLLVVPSADAGAAEVFAGVAAFRGDVRVVAAANDDVVGTMPREVFDRAGRAARREFRMVPACDHQFRGWTNGRVLSQAPMWAFLDEEPFPDPARGIELYD